MASQSRETLKRVRDRLVVCLELMHDEANASAKEEVNHAIEVLDNLIDSEDHRSRGELVYELIGKIIKKLPWLLSVMRDID